MAQLTGSGNTAYKHGVARRGVKRPVMYQKWQKMIQRCHNPNDKDYPRYGARGITVCKAWRESFTKFIEDMGIPPPYYTLDRKNNAGPYSKSNCRWASPKEQANNRRSTKMLTIDGKTRPLSEWSAISGIGSKTILYRLKHTTLSTKEAVFNKPNSK